MKIRFRKNSHEKYFTYESDKISSCLKFNLLADIVDKTDAKTIFVRIDK